MIPYKLAKQLKDAGFPCSRDSALVGRSIILEDGSWVSPNLAELIDACGEEKYFLLQQIPKGWIACYGKNPICVKDFNKTYDIAMAKLWLKLNKKNAI